MSGQLLVELQVALGEDGELLLVTALEQTANAQHFRNIFRSTELQLICLQIESAELRPRAGRECLQGTFVSPSTGFSLNGQAAYETASPLGLLYQNVIIITRQRPNWNFPKINFLRPRSVNRAENKLKP